MHHTFLYWSVWPMLGDVILWHVDSSVAIFLVWGGGGGSARPPNVPTKIIYVLIFRERAPQKHIFSGLKIHLHTMSYTINAVSSFNYLWYGAIYTTLYWQDTKSKRNVWICERAERASLNFVWHFHNLKLLFPSSFCWYFRYFLSETFIFRSQITPAYIIHNQCTFLISLMVWCYIPGVPKKKELWIFSTLHSKSGIFFDIIR